MRSNSIPVILQGYLPLILTLLYVPGFLFVHAANKFAILYYGDANSHSVIARSMFDSSEKFSFGTTWLPLYHLLLAPFCIPNVLFFNFISGFLFNLIFVFVALHYLSGILRLLNVGEHVKVFSLTLFALNPDFVYLAFTPMTEVAFIASLMVASFWFVDWLNSGANRSALWTSFFIVCCTLIRYEAWFLAPLPVLYTLFRALKTRTFSGKSIVVSGINLSAFSGIFFWMVYHIIYYGGAFTFLQSTKSAGFEPASKFLRFNVMGVLSVFSSNLFLMFGPVLTAALLFSIFVWAVNHKGNDSRFTFIILFIAAPVLYLLIALFFGYAQIKEHWNSRYLISAFPLVIVVFALMLKRANGKLAAGVFTIGLCYYIMQAAGLFPIITYADAKTHVYDRTVQSRMIGVYISDSLKTGNIGYFGGMTNASHRIMLFSATELKRFDIIRLNDYPDADPDNQKVVSPWNYYDLIIFEYKQAGYGGAPIPVILKKAGEAADHCRLILKTEYFMVYRKDS